MRSQVLLEHMQDKKIKRIAVGVESGTNMFGVGEGHRRQGIGRALFAAIRDAARERGLTRIELDVWAFNESAVRFYESIGFHTYRSYMACTLDENTKEDDARC